MSKLIKEIIEIISDAGVMVDDVSSLDPDKSLLEQDIDSLDMASILLGVEEKYEVKFPDEELDKFQTINQMIAHVERT